MNEPCLWELSKCGERRFNKQSSYSTIKGERSMDTYAMTRSVAVFAGLLIAVLVGCVSTADLGGWTPDDYCTDAGPLLDANVPDTCAPDAAEAP
jgi:hypothetical protein